MSVRRPEEKVSSTPTQSSTQRRQRSSKKQRKQKRKFTSPAFGRALANDDVVFVLDDAATSSGRKQTTTAACTAETPSPWAKNKDVTLRETDTPAKASGQLRSTSDVANVPKRVRKTVVTSNIAATPDTSSASTSTSSDRKTTNTNTTSAPVITIGQRHRGVIPTMIWKLSNGTKVIASQGSVVDFRGDAIVNAANERCVGGGGVDGAISRAGGSPLREARYRLPIVRRPNVRCPTGQAVITVGGRLRSNYVIHTVGPIYSQFQLTAADELLRTAFVTLTWCAFVLCAGRCVIHFFLSGVSLCL